MFMLIILIVSLCSAECVVEPMIINEDNVHYKIVDQHCSLSEIRDKYTGMRFGELALINSIFTFDTELTLNKCSHCILDCYELYLNIDNSTVIIDYPTKISMMEISIGEIILNKDMNIQQILLLNDPIYFFNHTSTNDDSVLLFYMASYTEQFSRSYSIPPNVNVEHYHKGKIDSLRSCNMRYEFNFDVYSPCDNLPVVDASKMGELTYVVIPDPFCKNNENNMNCEDKCEICMSAWEVDQKCNDICKSMNCLSPPELADYCRENYREYCDHHVDCSIECPYECPQCKECEQCHECEQCQDCSVHESVISIDFNSDKTHLTLEYNEKLGDRHGIVDINDETVFVLEARYSHYSNDAREKQWYYIKDSHIHILPTQLVGDVILIKPLELSKQFDFGKLTYKSTKESFYVFYDDESFDIFVKNPYDFLNSYTLNNDGSFTYKFTSIYTKKYRVGDMYNGKVIVAIV